MDSGSSPEISKLKAQVQALTDLGTRVQQLRNVPAWLLKTPSAMFPAVTVKNEFENLKAFTDTLCSNDVQEALKSAKESEEKDKSGLHLEARPHVSKRRRAPSADSPKPYDGHELKTTSMFPSADSAEEALRRDGLVEFIQQFNRSHSCKLHMWTPTRSAPKDKSPMIVRFLIPDILVAYCALAYEEDGKLVVESLTASGPREEIKPHCQSEYSVYQKLSQQIAKMIQSHPKVSFQELMHLMTSYEGLFVDRCSNCQRVLSLEGHVPPVARVWVEHQGDDHNGKWSPRHITCLHS